MASGGSSRSLQGASVEVKLYDIICGPCQTDNLDKKANHYCNECREYICSSCKDVHRKLAILKSHTILSGKQIPVPTSGKQRSGFAAYCSCNENQEVEIYCDDHHDLICGPCKKEKHWKCKTLDVQEKSTDYTSTRLSSVLTKTNSLIHEFERMQKQREADRKDHKHRTEECRKNIKDFRAKIDAYLDKLEQNTFQELDEYDQQQIHHIDQHISELTAGLQMLNSDKQKLGNAKHKANKIKMFTTEVQVSKSLQKYEAMLDEIENDMTNLTVTFEGNKTLVDFQTEIVSLGSLKGLGQSLVSSHNGGKKSYKKIILGKKATLQKQVGVRSGAEKKQPWITCCTFMPSGQAVLCDGSNKSVKLFDEDLVQRERLKLCSFPLSVSVVDDNDVIINMNFTKQLQYIQVIPKLETGRTIQLDKECRDIKVFGDEIYTVQWGDSGKGEVQVLDLDGNRKRKLQTNVKFYCPEIITVSSSGKIFVSGRYDIYDQTATVICMTTDGDLVYQYEDKELRDPRGMYLNAEDNIFVCDYDSNTVQVIAANGKKYGTLLSSSDGINKPSFIAYRETDDTLLIGCDYEEYVLICKLV